MKSTQEQKVVWPSNTQLQRQSVFLLQVESIQASITCNLDKQKQYVETILYILSGSDHI